MDATTAPPPTGGDANAAGREATFPWRDVGYVLPFALTTIIFIGNHLAGAYPFIGILVGFVGVPIVDYALGIEAGNPDPALEGALERKRIYDLILWTWVPLQLFLIVYGMWRFATLDMPTYARVLMVVASGIPSGAIGITIAHELGHRSNLVDKTCARLLLGSVCYLHFTIEHNRGHHIRVATPDDPATARLGESFYGFFLRTVPGQYRSAWHLENERLRKAGGRALSVKNRMLWFSLSPFVLGALAFAWLGWLGVAFFYGQAFVAVALLESVNYLEHYGLLRRQNDDGTWERVTPLHSWNASYPISNWLLFRLQRHADHHAYAARRYPILRHLPEGPQLPFGYPTMIPLTLVPWLWWRIMNPRVIAARKRAGTWTDDDEARFGRR